VRRSECLRRSGSLAVADLCSGTIDYDLTMSLLEVASEAMPPTLRELPLWAA
jgi:hypothetical protein